jgi:hypothetical protein
MLDRLVKAKRPAITASAQPGQGRSLTLPEPESWPEPLDGAKFLTALARAVRQYVVLDAAAADAAALWIVGTFAFDDFMIFPRRARRSDSRNQRSRRRNLARLLHALRSRIHRFGAKDSATPRQPFRPEVVTHVLGTICYLCLRAGQKKFGGPRPMMMSTMSTP